MHISVLRPIATALGGKRAELDDHWERCARSAATAHSHLNSIFEKTGVRRQAELVRLMFESWISG